MTDFTSATQTIPPVFTVPRHVAIIMDGNGRWAKQRYLPRVAGHKRGVEAVRETVKACGDLGIEYLTLFAFSSENWRRPQDEVSVLMQLFIRALEQEVGKLNTNNIRFKVVGDLAPFDPRIVELVKRGESLTENHRTLTLTVAANYGGRWDMMQAMQKVMAARAIAGADPAAPVTEAEFTPHLSMSYAPEPDLFIRTGGEQRISNFLLWQLAYTELYFTDALWPDFGRAELDKAVASYQQRERRFGRTSEQLRAALPESAPAANG
ncbi:MAG: di-trans,poly-cis-decaprenylcistransferase [Betaproteobacteria bacterium]|nr:di-trans,poly-cis-decaprenylcistransferase [Betaproteobacteria bacterium]